MQTGLYSGFEGMKDLGILGWDLGRAVFVARLAFEAGFFNAGQAWERIQIISNKAHAAFKSSDEFAASYILGAALRSGVMTRSGHISEYVDIYKWLRSDPESPWVKTAQNDL